jgi:predicted nucleotidyltransferase
MADREAGTHAGHGQRVTTRCEALRIAREIGGELVASGATAVVLMGSFARGDQGPYSDLDILALGEGPAYQLQRCAGMLVAVSWSTMDEVESAFSDPGRAGYAVQGWRDAVIIHDGQAVAQSLITAARDWRWSDLEGASCDRYVAGEICGLAEEAHKLANLLAMGNQSGAAVQRNLLALRLGVILAAHFRLLYASENDLWNLVGERMNSGWRESQSRSLGLEGERFLTTCAAALELYRRAVEEVRALLDERELAVVEHACGLETWLREGGLL